MVLPELGLGGGELHTGQRDGIFGGPSVAGRKLEKQLGLGPGLGAHPSWMSGPGASRL